MFEAQLPADAVFVTPIVLGRVLKLSGSTVILAILAGGSLAGLLGMLLAVPVVGILKGILEIVKEGDYYKADDCSA